MTTLRRKRDAESIPFFKRAIELDPNFALAYASLGRCLLPISDRPAWPRRTSRRRTSCANGSSEREKYSTSPLSTTRRSPGRWRRPTSIYELWPRAIPGTICLTQTWRTTTPSLGQYEKGRQSREKPAVWSPTRCCMATSESIYIALNRLDEAKSTFDQALARKLEGAISAPGDLRAGVLSRAMLPRWSSR